MHVSAMPGAVYRPYAEMAPQLAVQVTAVLVLPVIVAANCFVVFTPMVAETGLSVTPTTVTLGMLAVTEFEGALSIPKMSVFVDQYVCVWPGLTAKSTY